MIFVINNFMWKICFADSNSNIFIKPDYTMTVGVTDNNIKTIFISDKLKGAFLYRVIYHELCHAFIFSYGIDLSEEQEEMMVELMTMYNEEISNIANKIYTNMKEIAL